MVGVMLTINLLILRGVYPLAENSYSISPYAYRAGNPVRYIDLKRYKMLKK